MYTLVGIIYTSHFIGSDLGENKEPIKFGSALSKRISKSKPSQLDQEWVGLVSIKWIQSHRSIHFFLKKKYIILSKNSHVIHH